MATKPETASDEHAETALLDLAETFGRPHIHSGIGIRKLGKHLFECRGNRDFRILFLDISSSTNATPKIVDNSRVLVVMVVY